MDDVVDEACVDGYRSRLVVVDVSVEAARWRGRAKIWACTSVVPIGYNKREKRPTLPKETDGKQVEKPKSNNIIQANDVDR